MNLFLIIYAYFFLFALVVSLALIPVVMAWARKNKFIAMPKKERFHSVPTPLLGGIAIIGSFYATLLLNAAGIKLGLPVISTYAEELYPYCIGALHNFPKMAVVLICGFLIFLLGLVDDLKTLGPKRKFTFELFLGLVLYCSDIRISVFGLEWINLLATMFWVVLITNAFNLLDNIDALASGVALIASFILLLFCIMGGQVLISIMLLIFMGAIVGFFRYNFPPASIFMGDCGSLFIGFMMSTFMILATFYDETGFSIMPIVTPLMILSVPLYDTISVVWIRIKNKKNPFVGDKNHFSHRLLAIGMSVREAVTYIFLVGLCTGIGALSLWNAPLFSQIILLVQTFLVVMLLHHMKNFRQKQKAGERKDLS